jgi:predicted neutral ceramidase superfamily lipid hydrolase
LKADRLIGLYPFFFAFLLFSAGRSFSLWDVPPNTNRYAQIWLFTEPAIWVLHILVAYEIQRRVLKDFPGVASLGRWAFMVALAAAVVVSSLTLLPDLFSSVKDFPLLQLYNVVRRGVATTLLIFLLLLSGFLVWFPVPLARNLVIHSLIFTFWSLSVTGSLFVRNIFGPETAVVVSTALLGFNCVCLASWFFLLNRNGEEVKTVLLHPFRPEMEEQLLGHLAALNRGLARK